MKNLLLSAAIGDISGQPYEFKGRTKNYDTVDLLRPDNTYTDDTVCTFACAEALLHNLDMAHNLWQRCRADFHRGFGGRFAKWLIAQEVQPSYGSFGNGSAMRCSAAGFMAKTEDECIELAVKTALPTHDHPEGIKGAVATALAIYYGMHGFDKAYIRKNVLDKYYPTWSHKSYAEIKPGYYFDETCQLTVPAALICFLESKDYSDCLKLSISLGGDADTLAAISGPMAYAFYREIPAVLVENAKKKLPKWMLLINDELDNVVSTYNNHPLDKAPRIYHNVVRPDYTPEHLSTLKKDEVFVFGSNLAGSHGGGAARAAYLRFGAKMGQGVGLQGQSYAIPTMQGGVDTIKPYVDEFIQFARSHRDLFFYVTRIGCGIAGFKDEQIAPLFCMATLEPNICLPESFVRFIQPVVPQEIKTMLYGQMRTLVDLLKALNQKSPIRDADDARNRLEEIIGHNIRYVDENAYMALRTLWCLMTEYESEKSPIDFNKLEQDMMDFHKDYLQKADNLITHVLYRYSVEKMIRYIQYLNEFRRYTNVRQIEEDLPSIGFSHCSSNDENYYYSFQRESISKLFWILLNEWDNISKGGHLDNDALEEVIFGRYNKMLAKHGFSEMIRLAYGDVGCHPNIRGPLYQGDDSVHGPYFSIRGNSIEKGCTDFRRFPFSSTQFEYTFARKILMESEKYICIHPETWDECFIPREDYTLPVYSRCEGKMHFDTEEEKIKFIQSRGNVY